MRAERREFGRVVLSAALAVSLGIGVAACGTDAAGQRQQPQGEWRAINGNDASTRYSALDQINASNFERLQVAWEWKGEDAPIDLGGETLPRNLPIYANGKLITTAGPKRTVVALDPATGKSLWAFQEPETFPNHFTSVAEAARCNAGVDE